MNDERSRERVDGLKQSPSYVKAYEDIDFLNRDELRPVRLLLELLKPELLQEEHNIRSTIVVFGSARLKEPSEARADLQAAEARAAAAPNDAGARRAAAEARRVVALSRFYDEAREFGRIASSGSQAGGDREYVIVTGGGPGIMEAANRGAFDAGAVSVGLNITLPMEQQPNPYVTPDLCFQFRYFAIRKMHFMLRARALVAFPGGYGTFDELFETLTLVQTGKVNPLPVILFCRDFWEKAVGWDHLVETGVISPEDVHLFRYAETAAEAWDLIARFHRDGVWPPPQA